MSKAVKAVKASKAALSSPSSQQKAPDRGFLRRPKHTLSPPFSAGASLASTPRGSYKNARGYRPPTVESIVDSDDDSSVYKIAVAEDIEQSPAPTTRNPTRGRGPKNASPPAFPSCCSKCSQLINHDEEPSLAEAGRALANLETPTPNEDARQSEDTSSARNSPTGPPTPTRSVYSGEDEHSSPRPSRQASTAQDLNRGGSQDALDETYLPSQRCVSSEPRTFSVHTASPSAKSEQPGQQYARQSDEQSYDYASRTSPSPPQHGQGRGSWSESQSHVAAEQQQGQDGYHEEGERFQSAKDFFTKGRPHQSIPNSQTMADEQVHDAHDERPKETPPYDFSRLFGPQPTPKTSAYCDPTPGHSASFTDADVHALYDRVPSFSRAGFGGHGYHRYDDDFIHENVYGPFPGSDSHWQPRDPYIDDDDQGYDSNHEDEDGGPANHFASLDDESSLVLWENPIVEDTLDGEFERTASDERKAASPKEHVQGSPRRSTSTLQVAEYTSSDIDSDSEGDSAFSHASAVTVKKYSRMVECEVASVSDDESGRPRNPVRIRCR